MLIDDFSDEALVSQLGTQWRVVSDQVMGGVSTGSLSRQIIQNRPCMHLIGDVRLENNGGFIQAALDLRDKIDASGYTGIRLVARGNNEKYALHLRTPDNMLPWQSYRAHFTVKQQWQAIDLAFDRFAPHRIDAPLDTTRLHRIGLVAIGRAFHADLAVCELRLYR